MTRDDLAVAQVQDPVENTPTSDTHDLAVTCMRLVERPFGGALGSFRDGAESWQWSGRPSQGAASSGFVEDLLGASGSGGRPCVCGSAMISARMISARGSTSLGQAQYGTSGLSAAREHAIVRPTQRFLPPITEVVPFLRTPFFRAWTFARHICLFRVRSPCTYALCKLRS